MDEAYIFTKFVKLYLDALQYASGIHKRGFEWLPHSTMQVDIQVSWSSKRVQCLKEITPLYLLKQDGVWFWKTESGDCLYSAMFESSSKSRTWMPNDSELIRTIFQFRDQEAPVWRQHQNSQCAGEIIQIHLFRPSTAPWKNREGSLRMIHLLEAVLEVAR